MDHEDQYVNFTYQRNATDFVIMDLQRTFR